MIPLGWVGGFCFLVAVYDSSASPRRALADHTGHTADCRRLGVRLLGFCTLFFLLEIARDNHKFCPSFLWFAVYTSVFT